MGSLDNEEGAEIHIEIRSNWGHSERIGLTEIQFFDTTGRRLDVAARDIYVTGACDIKGDISNLFNNKFKVLLGSEESNWFLLTHTCYNLLLKCSCF